MEFLSEYDFGIEYIKGKENRVADALSKRRHLAAMVTIKSNFREQVVQALPRDEQYERVKQALEQDPLDHRFSRYVFESDGILRFQGCMYIPSSAGLRELVLEEFHNPPYSRHPGVTKMVEGLRPLYFWLGLKRDVIAFIARCLECQ